MQVRIIHFTGDRKAKSTASIRRDWFHIQIRTEQVIDFSSNSARLYGTSLIYGEWNRALSNKYPTTREDRQQAVTRALLYWSGQLRWGPYDLVKNNCEHFVRFIFTGQKDSKAVNLVRTGFCFVAGAVTGSLFGPVGAAVGAAGGTLVGLAVNHISKNIHK